MQQFFWDVFKQLFGVDATFANVTVFVIMYLAGAALIFGLEVRGRDKESERTPNQFNLVFLLKDNTIRIFTTILMAFIFAMVGANVLMFIGYASGVKIEVPEALGRVTPIILGMSSDWVSMKLKYKFGKK